MKIGALLFIANLLLMHVIAQDAVLTVRVFEKKKLVERKVYGINANLLEKETLINKEPEIWFCEKMSYENGRLIKSVHFVDGADTTFYLYEYNDRGKTIKKIETKNGEVVGEVSFLYDDKGRLINENNLMGKRKSISVSYEYNNEGLLIKRNENIADSSKNINLSEFYYYNPDKKMTRVIGVNNNDTISDIRFEYDKFGFKLKQNVILHGDTTLTVEWKYGPNGSKPIIERHLSDGYVVRQTINRFNKSNRIKKEITTEYRIYSGKMKPEKTVRKYKYFWNE